MFISNAYAQTAGAATAAPTDSLFIIFPIMLGFMYFFVYRPQAKRNKELKAMIDALAKGDEVITTGGMAGKIAEVRDVYVKLTIADNVDVLVQKTAIGVVLPKGSLKNA